jgi:Fe-S cluster biogenesis protein NfuA
MTTEAERLKAEADRLREEVETWLTAQMPVIRMHGGESAVREVDPVAGRVVVELGGACSGCGISARTAQNIKLDLADEFEEVEDVVVRVGDGTSGTPWEEDNHGESFMGVDRNEGGRGGRGESGPGDLQGRQ